MPQIQEVWNKLNPRERLTAIGALVVGLGWIVSLAGYGVSAGTISLLGALAVLAIFFLKYSPTQNITWPAPIPTLVLGISAVVALLAAIDVLTSLRYLNGFGVGIVALILEAIGAALMAWGAWQEYQLTKPATTSTPSSIPPTAPPASTPPPAAPTAPTPPPASTSDTDDLPPA